MKRLKIQKEEKIILAVGLIIIIVLVCTGLYKQSVEPKKVDPISTVDKKPITDLTLKKENFPVEINTELKKDARIYLKGSEDALNKVMIDFRNVDNKKAGEYKARASLNDLVIEIPIVVADTKAPVIVPKHDSVLFTVNKDSKISEIAEYFKATATDEYDGDKTSYIKGYPTSFPSSDGVVTYKLTCKDLAGNVGEYNIQVNYVIEKKP
ncbi:MAG: hypothetical protein RR546_07930 [Erysipelotrichaceae bacterium]